MVKFKIIHEIEKCIGCEACAGISPDHWYMEGDKSHLVDADKVGEEEHLNDVEGEKNFELNKEAADVCPVDCIHVKKVEKKDD